ncbi:hypothetical protein RIF29_18358 [Crotalaria pallida]|uniref:Uncharacterized protein n=1 Tax=Crotalaria pallida TaxID=3830 RepID=A0AAN9IFE2_CROPI
MEEIESSTQSPQKVGPSRKNGCQANLDPQAPQQRQKDETNVSIRQDPPPNRDRPDRHILSPLRSDFKLDSHPLVMDLLKNLPSSFDPPHLSLSLFFFTLHSSFFPSFSLFLLPFLLSLSSLLSLPPFLSIPYQPTTTTTTIKTLISHSHHSSGIIEREKNCIFFSLSFPNKF